MANAYRVRIEKINGNLVGVELMRDVIVEEDEYKELEQFINNLD